MRWNPLFLDLFLFSQRENAEDKLRLKFLESWENPNATFSKSNFRFRCLCGTMGTTESDFGLVFVRSLLLMVALAPSLRCEGKQATTELAHISLFKPTCKIKNDLSVYHTYSYRSPNTDESSEIHLTTAL